MANASDINGSAVANGGEREQFYKNIIEGAADVITLHAPDGTILYANSGLARPESLGYRPEEVVGRNALELIHPEDRDAVARAIANDLAGTPTTVEARVQKKDGAWIYVEMRGRAITGPDGKPTVVAYSRNVTERVSLVEKLRKSEEYYKSLLEGSSDLLLVVDSTGVVRYASASITRIFGYLPEDIVGKSVLSFIHPDDLALAAERLTNVDRYQNIPVELRVQRKDGTWCECEGRGKSITSPDGERLLAVNTTDITERKRAAREQALLAALVKSSDDGIASLGPGGTVTSWNDGAERLFGYTAAEAIGRNIAELYVAPQLREDAQRLLAADFASAREHPISVRRLEVPARRKDGAPLEISITVSGIYSSSGKLLGLSNIIHDVTERKRAEREQALLAAIVSSTDDAVVSLSPDGVITSWNRGAEAVLGFSSAEAIGQPVTIYLPPAAHAFALESVRQQLETARRHEPIERLDIQLQRKDKTLIDAAIAASGVYDTSGNLIGLSGIIRDMTERKLNEQRLAAMASIVNASQDVVISVDAESRIIGWNPAAERVHGLKREEVLGHGIDLFIPRDELQTQLESDRRILQTGEAETYEHRVPARDGTWLTFLVNAFPIRDANGAITGVGGIGRDVSHLKAIEKELRQAQEYTRGLIESSIDAMVVVDRELHITDGNEQLARLTEVPKKRLIGSRFDAYFKDPKLAAAAIERTLSDGFITNCDLVLCAASGREVMVSFSASIFYSAGCVFGIFGVARDVTDQRAIERKLEEERQYSRSLVECSPDALLVSDPQLTVTDLNDRAVEFTGYGRNELIGARLAMLFTDPKSAAENAGVALEQGLVREVELSFLTRDARQVPVAMSASVYRGADGAARGLLIDLRNISEHKRYESGRALLAAIVDSSGDAIFSESIDLTITSWNAAAERLFGYTAVEIVGRSAAVLVPLDRRSELLGHIEAVQKSGKSETYETRRVRKDGTAIDLDVTESPILDEAGKVTGLSVTAHDIGERKRMHAEVLAARDEALEAARLKSEFLANMSHEIRTPLNSIIGMTGLLIEGSLSAEQREFAEDVRDSGNTLLNLINDILDFSKVTAGKMIFEELDFELTGAVEGAIELVAEQTRRKGLELTVSIDPDCPQYLRGDPGRLRQVLVNLLSNAVKFTKQGEISVQVNKLSENPKETILRFEVRDTGIGIPKDRQHLLFRPFTQLDASTARHFGGTGLGLSISRELVERMGGTIAVTSTPGVGSTFWFTARLAKQIDVQHRASEQYAPVAGVKVLIVDDNANNREILRRTMTRWGMQVETAGSAQAALEQMRRQTQDSRFRIAVVDVMMPEVDGFQFARQVKAEPELGDPPIIFVSSAGTRADFAAALRGLNVGGWLMKPVPESALYRALVEVLAPQQEQPVHPVRALKIPANRKFTALIAEDNPVNQKLARLQMTKLGFQVDTVGNGREAIEALSRVAYDVVLMDCQMPEMDGYDATREIRGHETPARHTMIVAMTANALAGDRDKCIAAGMDAYVSKPVELEALEKVLAEVLAPALNGANGAAENAPAEDPRADPSPIGPAGANSEPHAKP